MTSGVPDLDAFPEHDGQVRKFATSLGIPGIVDIHVHGLPEALQQAVWRFFDALDSPPWPITYRDDEATRLATLRDLGVVRHTALAYAHREGVASWCNDHTLDLAEAHDQVVPTFTFHAEDDAERYVADALARGGRVAKVHLQVGRFDPLDPRLAQVWAELERLRVPVVIHASAVYGVDGGEAWCGTAPVKRLLARHPDLRLVIAHLGGPQVREFVDLAVEHAVWLDQSMALMDPPYLVRVQHRLLEHVAAAHDRIVFGTDFPSIPHPFSSQLRGLAPLQLTRTQLADLLFHRGTRLLDEARPDLAAPPACGGADGVA